LLYDQHTEYQLSLAGEEGEEVDEVDEEVLPLLVELVLKTFHKDPVIDNSPTNYCMRIKDIHGVSVEVCKLK